MHESAAVSGLALASQTEDTPLPEAVPTNVISRSDRAKPLTTRGLLSLLYDDLKGMAARFLSRESRGHSMDPTELVHESFLKLEAQTRAAWHGRTHFLAVSAQAMRRILIDDARTRTRKKRGGKGRGRVELQDYHAVSEDAPDGILIVGEIVDKLTRLDPTHARIFQLRVFEGLGMEEIGQILGVSSRTAERHWAVIRAWTLRELAVMVPNPAV